MRGGSPKRPAPDPDLIRFVINLAIADARRDHLIATGQLTLNNAVQSYDRTASVETTSKNGGRAWVRLRKAGA